MHHKTLLNAPQAHTIAVYLVRAADVSQAANLHELSAVAALHTATTPTMNDKVAVNGTKGFL